MAPRSDVGIKYRVSPRRMRATGGVAVLLFVAVACSGPLPTDDSASAASIRIETRTPTTLADSDMVTMHASVLDATGSVLSRAAVTWTSLNPKTIDVSADGHLRGHVATSNFCCDGAGLWGREAKIVATLASNPSIADTTIAYVMRYAIFVGLKPNGAVGQTFAQVASLAPGDSAPLRATGYVYGPAFRNISTYDSLPVDQGMLWTSRSPQIATIDSKGVVTGRSAGMATIVVQSRGGLATDSGIVIVQQPTLRLVALVPNATMCGLGEDGGVWCWGDLASISNPPTAASLTGSRFPAIASGGTKKYSSIAADGLAACGIATDGITYCWAIKGTSVFGVTSAPNSPVPFAPDLRFTAIRMGGGSACGLTADGALYCWGSNSYGQLGDGTKLSRSAPTLVSGGLRFTAFSAGNVSCGISVDGDSYCWGHGENGAIGNGVLVSTSVPLKVATTEKFVEIQGDFYHACARTSAGAVSCWGDNSFGELGDGTASNHYTPLRITGGYLFSSLSVDETTCGLTPDGGAVCWGYNAFGTVGDGTFATAHPTPTLASGSLRFTSLATGGTRTCGPSSGVFYCWGANTTGTMGINRMYSVGVPTRLAGVLP